VTPDLLLLHGFADSGACWSRQEPRWSPTWTVRSPDARGHGTAYRWDADTLARGVMGVLVADVVRLVVDAARQTVLVGHSMGAATAAEAAVQVTRTHPGLVAGLVLEDPPWRAADATSAAVADPVAGTERVAWLAELSALSQRERVEAGRSAEPGWTEDEYVAWATSKAQVDPRVAAGGAPFTSGRWLDLVTTLATQRIPTLLVTGDAGAILTPQVLADIERVGGARITTSVVPGAGHSVRRDRHDGYHAVVDPWLAARDA
jgi:pimeloyl-ACP methyl ester carboxylesterase